jgi:hypothetical protein
MKKTTALVGILALAVLLIANNSEAVQAHVVLTQSGTNYAYTLFNDEATGSQSCLNTLYLSVNAPISVVSSPPGWSFTTDNSTYVSWFSTDGAMPYPNDIVPGASASGFVIQTSILGSESFDCVMGCWDHSLTNSGPANINSVSAPSVFGDSLGVAPTITNVNYSTVNSFYFTLIGIPSFDYTIQSSTNLTDWTSQITNSAPFDFADTNAINSSERFYRSMLFPDDLSFAFLGD